MKPKRHQDNLHPGRSGSARLRAAGGASSHPSLGARAPHSALKPTLGWIHLMCLGIGGIVGTGIYTLIGVGAGLAGPAVIISFVVAGLVCADPQ